MALVSEMHSVPEIADALGVSRSQVQRAIAASALPRKKGHGRQVVFWPTERDYRILQALAEGAKVPPGTMAHRIFRAFAPSVEVGKKKLGKDGIAKKSRTQEQRP